MIRSLTSLRSLPVTCLAVLLLAAGAVPSFAGGTPCGGNGCDTPVFTSIIAPNGETLDLEFVGHLDSISYMGDALEVSPTLRISKWQSVEAQGWWGPLGKVRVTLDEERESSYHMVSRSPTGKPFFPADAKARFFWKATVTNPLTGEAVTLRADEAATYVAESVMSFPPQPGTVFTLATPMVLHHDGLYTIETRAEPGTSTVVYSGPIFDPPLLVNEVSLGPGLDPGGEFIELFDGGAGGTALDGVSLVLFDGDGQSLGSAIDLSGHHTDAAGLFVVGADEVNGVGLVPATPLPGEARAVALYVGDAADFPAGTAAHDVTLMDAMVFQPEGASVTAAVSALLRQGEVPVGLTTAKRGGAPGSLQRMPNGAGWRRATDTFEQLAATPGQPNRVAPTYTRGDQDGR